MNSIVTKAYSCWLDLQKINELQKTEDHQMQRIYQAAYSQMSKRLKDMVAKMAQRDLMSFTEAIHNQIEQESKQ